MNTQIQKPCLEDWENALGRLRGGVLNRESEDEQPTSMESACEEFGLA